MLVLAAKAAGLDGWSYDYDSDSMESPPIDTKHGVTYKYWSPLHDDGDALRLAMDLGLVVDCSRASAGEPFKMHHFGRDGAKDQRAATRRAIVRAAAEVGRSMP